MLSTLLTIGYPVPPTYNGKTASQTPAARPANSNSSDKERSTYSPQSLYSLSNNSASSVSEQRTPEKDGWSGFYNYAMISHATSAGKLGSRSQYNSKHDYQDVYKHRKRRGRVEQDHSCGTVREQAAISDTTTSEAPAPPRVPQKHFNDAEDSHSQPDTSTLAGVTPPRIAPVSGYLPKVGGTLPFSYCPL